MFRESGCGGGLLHPPCGGQVGGARPAGLFLSLDPGYGVQPAGCSRVHASWHYHQGWGHAGQCLQGHLVLAQQGWGRTLLCRPGGRQACSVCSNKQRCRDAGMPQGSRESGNQHPQQFWVWYAQGCLPWTLTSAWHAPEEEMPGFKQLKPGPVSILGVRQSASFSAAVLFVGGACDT